MTRFAIAGMQLELPDHEDNLARITARIDASRVMAATCEGASQFGTDIPTGVVQQRDPTIRFARAHDGSASNAIAGSEQLATTVSSISSSTEVVGAV